MVLLFDQIISSTTYNQLNDARRVHKSVRLVVVAISDFSDLESIKKKHTKIRKA